MRNILLVLLISFFSSYTYCQCNRATDSLELVKLYDDLNGQNWVFEDTTISKYTVPNFGNKWDIDSPVDMWHGITIDSIGCVTQIILEDCNIEGRFLGYEFPNVEYLILDRNKIEGDVALFNRYSNLIILDLFYNSISGELSSLDSLGNLEKLFLNSNIIEGEIPNFSTSERLTNLNLSYNELTGRIPNFLSLNEMKFLILSGNELEGNFPDFSHMQKMVSLSVANNKLTGEVPHFSHPVLRFLYFNDNNLTGPLYHFDYCPYLTTLVCSNNSLTDTISDFKNLSYLSFVSMFKNEFIGLPPDFVNCPNLKTIQLGNNNLTGSIPDYEHLLNSLVKLRLNDNKIIGCYEDWICNIEVSFEGNSQMPWKGDHTNYCNGEDQLSAPCDDITIDTPNSFINDMCECVEETTAVEEDSEIQYDIFPNPVVSQLHIDGDFTNENYFIYNTNGDLVSTGRVQSKLYVDNLSVGIYILEIKSDLGVFIKRIIKI